MISLIIGVTFWAIYLGGLFYFAPKFAAEEAAQRGRLRVHQDDTAIGIGKGVFWPLLWFGSYTQARANARLNRMPELAPARMRELQRRNDEMERELNE